MNRLLLRLYPGGPAQTYDLCLPENYLVLVRSNPGFDCSHFCYHFCGDKIFFSFASEQQPSSVVHSVHRDTPLREQFASFSMAQHIRLRKRRFHSKVYFNYFLSMSSISDLRLICSAGPSVDRFLPSYPCCRFRLKRSKSIQ